MGAKSSKTPTAQDAFADAISADAFLLQISNDLNKKRPLSRAIPEFSLLEAHNPQARNNLDAPEEEEEESDDEGALVYVFNPDRITSKRVSKRLPSNSLSSVPSVNMSSSLPQHYTMVNTRTLTAPGKSIDCCVFGRTGSNDGENRSKCQDEAHFEVNRDDMVCFGCFDGHGADGHLIAALCAQQLESCVLDDQQYYLQQGDFESAVRGGIASFARRLEEISPNKVDIEHSGTTAAIGLVDNKTNTVYIANVGDTRVIGARRQQESGFALVQLSEEHILSQEKECERITNCGGVVRPMFVDGQEVGPPRCYFNHEHADLPGLMISRTLGDTIAKSIGVNAECAVLSAQGLAFVVVASDGVWEVMTNEEVVAFVGQRLALATKETALSQLLCVEAHKRWLALEQQVGDDLSCVVVLFET